MNNPSDRIKRRLIDAGKSFNCNDNISDYIMHNVGEFQNLLSEVSDKVQDLLDSLVIDTVNDHNTRDTATRVAKMLLLETFSGRYHPKPSTTAFPNIDGAYDEIYVTGPITIRSTCAHHLQNITGKCYVGVFPGDKVIGLSKFNRLVDWIASRPTIQEEMTIQIADEIEQETSAKGVAVLVSAEHGCMSHRGIKEHDPLMTTSVMRGLFKDHPHIKKEFFDIVARHP